LIKVLIVDDHKVLTDSLKYLLDKSNEIAVVGVSPKPDDSLRMYRELKPDVVLMDIYFYDEQRQMLQMNGIEALKQIKDYDGNAKVLILTSETSNRFLEKAMPLTDGYIVKDCSIEKLIEAIKCCYGGLKIFDPLIDGVVAGEAKSNGTRSAGANSREYGLAERELKIINLVAEGKTCKEIAADLDLAEGYIRNMLIGIYDKLGIESHKSTALVAFAAKMGLLR